ncbi:MAG TPA: hypothetical protein VIM62_04625 [Acidobacteriaceae bacterium]
MSSTAGLILGCVLFLILFVYVLWPEKQIAQQRQKTRLDFLEEQKEQVYANLRDLNFEYQAGKYPQEDYEAQRALLEKEAAAVLVEMDQLQGTGIRDQESVKRA